MQPERRARTAKKLHLCRSRPLQHCVEYTGPSCQPRITQHCPVWMCHFWKSEAPVCLHKESYKCTLKKIGNMKSSNFLCYQRNHITKGLLHELVSGYRRTNQTNQTNQTDQTIAIRVLSAVKRRNQPSLSISNGMHCLSVNVSSHNTGY